MNVARIWTAAIAALVMLAAGCGETVPSGNTNDATAASVGFDVFGTTAATSTIPAAGATITNQSNLNVVVVAGARDPESGVKDLRITGDVQWDCANAAGDSAQHRSEGIDIAATSARPPGMPQTATGPLSASGIASVNLDAFGCQGTDTSKGLTANLTARAINGAGATSTSGKATVKIVNARKTRSG